MTNLLSSFKLHGMLMDFSQARVREVYAAIGRYLRVTPVLALGRTSVCPRSR